MKKQKKGPFYETPCTTDINIHQFSSNSERLKSTTFNLNYVRSR